MRMEGTIIDKAMENQLRTVQNGGKLYRRVAIIFRFPSSSLPNTVISEEQSPLYFAVTRSIRGL